MSLKQRERKAWPLWEKIWPLASCSSSETLRITAATLKQYGEPRLLAKFDTREDLPPVLRAAGRFILPLSRKEYALVVGDGYHDLEPQSPPQAFHAFALPGDFVSFRTGESEHRYVSYAFYCGLVEHFTGVPRLFPTIGGRMIMEPFTFRVGQVELTTGPIQIEIDKGFETDRTIVLLEAKVGRSITNFHIRQLYYPFRHWRTQAGDKEIWSLLFTYDKSEGTYNFWWYEFQDEHDYGSIRLREKASFVVRVAPEALRILRSLRESPVNWAPEAIIPQADSFSKVAAIPGLVAKGSGSAGVIARHFRMTVRQGNYYRQAAEALGLVRMEGGTCRLTDDGAHYLRVAEKPAGPVFLLTRATRIPVMHETLRRLLTQGRITISEIAGIIKEHSDLSGSTPMRRAETIRGWLMWFAARLGIFQLRYAGSIIRLTSEWSSQS